MKDMEMIIKVFKAFCDENRLKILEMLHSSEKCGCVLLEDLQISQPTLSHDMRILVESKIVKVYRSGKNTYYSLNAEYLQSFHQTLHNIFTEKSNCICHQETNNDKE